MRGTENSSIIFTSDAIITFRHSRPTLVHYILYPHTCPPVCYSPVTVWCLANPGRQWTEALSNYQSVQRRYQESYHLLVKKLINITNLFGFLKQLSWEWIVKCVVFNNQVGETLCSWMKFMLTSNYKQAYIISSGGGLPPISSIITMCEHHLRFGTLIPGGKVNKIAQF